MAYRIELISGLSHTYNGRTVRRSQPQVIENPAEIAYYRMQPDFVVTDLDRRETAKPASISDSAPLAPINPTESSDFEKPPRKNKPKKKTEKIKKQVVLAYPEEDLKAMKKSEIIAIATREFGLLVEGDEKKLHLIKLIMDEQIKEMQDDEGGELEDDDGE